MKRRGGEISLRKAFALALLLHVAALALLTRLSLREARAGGLEEIRVFGTDAPVEFAHVSLVEMAPPPARTGTAREVVNLGPAERRHARELVQPERPRVPARQNPVTSPTRSAPRVRPGLSGTPGGGVGTPRPGGPLDMGPPSRAGTVPVVTSSGPGTPAGTVPGEGTGSGAGIGSGNGDSRSGGTGGNGTGTGNGEGPGRGGQGVGEGSRGDGGTQPAHHSKMADRALPLLVSQGTLTYPAAAAADGAEGTVVLKLVVSETGEVVDQQVTQSSGDSRLDKAAREYVRRFRYRPAVQNGEARRVTIKYTVEFSLK